MPVINYNFQIYYWDKQNIMNKFIELINLFSNFKTQNLKKR